MRFLPNVTFEPLAGFTEKFWCHGQIALGSGDVHVPEISRQLGQQALHISSFAIQTNQPMNSEGVSQVMKSGLKTSSMELYKVLCNRPSEEENRHRWQSTTH
jgi:hypothetical protein